MFTALHCKRKKDKLKEIQSEIAKKRQRGQSDRDLYIHTQYM